MNLSIIEWIIFGFDLTYFSLPYKIRIDYFYPYPSSKEGNEFNPMSTIKQSYHGSDIEIIEKVYNIPKEEIINFSGNVNPLGVSKTVKEELAAHLDLISTYPDRNYTTLRQKIGTYVDTNPKNIIVGNGATELISILIQNLKPTHALIIGPTYSEYEREIRLEGGNVHYYVLTESLDFQIHVPDLLQQITTSIGLLVICNPNNPTSSAFSQKDLIQILEHCKKTNTFVLIDETYMEFATNITDLTAIPLIPKYKNLMVLRGVSKFFAAPGLRLGYGICGNSSLLETIQQQKNPWTLNTLGSFAGKIMFEDYEYMEKTKVLIGKERNRIYKELLTWPEIHPYPPIANFILVKIKKENLSASKVFENLIQQKMMIRDASSFPFLDPRFFRFCFMMPDQNDQLLAALKLILNQD